MGNFLLGLGIGLTAGVLLAPKPGSETRRYIADKAAEGSNYVAEQGRNFMEQGRQVMDQASDLLERGRTAVMSQKEKMSDILSNVSQTERQYQPTV